MKLLLSLFLLVAVAWGNSTHYYGWVPHREFVYRFESQVLTGIPEIRKSQWGGVKLTSTVRVQTFPDYSLRIKMESSRFLTVNGDVTLHPEGASRGRVVKELPEEELVTGSGSSSSRSLHETPIPSELKTYLERPFLVHLKRGVVESFFVESEEPVVITNIKKALLSQIQMDITGMRRPEVESNHLSINSINTGSSAPISGSGPESVLTPMESIEGISYFTTFEESLHGDCQTSYTIHPLPKYRSFELEEEMKVEELKLNKLQHLQGGLSSGEEVCRGKEYFQITKTKNFDNCRTRPVYNKWVGIESKCDPTKSECRDLMTHMSSTSYIVCGTSIKEFTIRKAVTENTIVSTPYGWNTKENIKNTARVSLELLREESSFTPMSKPTSTKEKKSLVFEFPISKPTSSISSPESYERSPRSMEEGLSESKKNEIESKTGIRPLIPMPDLKSAPKLMVTYPIETSELITKVTEELKKISREVFESPESCTSRGDVAGHLASIASYLRPLSYDTLKSLKSQVLSNLSGMSSETQKSMKALFYDVLSFVGTNPATMLIKSEIESGELKGRTASNVLQSMLRSIRTPTPELLRELLSLIKTTKHMHSSTGPSTGTWVDKLFGFYDLHTVGLIHYSNLLYRACINPETSISEFPVRLYGRFCTNTSSVITEEYIPYLETEVLSSSSSSSSSEIEEHRKLVAISSLGKLGHVKSLKPLVKVISGEISESTPVVRSLAVYSMKRIAKINPTMVKPILLALIDNPAESTEVRIAAVSVLPWTKPTTAELQKIAVRTWFEPSKQVASFIYTTFKSLIETEVPELKSTGLKVRSIISLVKPFTYGVQFSHNNHIAKLVEYLKSSVSQKVSFVYSEEEIIPTRIGISTNVYHGSWIGHGLSLSAYYQGMDYVLDKYLYLGGQTNSHASSQVSQELNRISEELKIKKRTHFSTERPSKSFWQTGAMGYERMITLTKESVMEILEKASETLRNNPQMLSSGYPMDFSRALQTIDVQAFGPSDAGFPVFTEKNLPIVYSMKGYIKSSETRPYLPVPTKFVAKLMPVLNAKMQTHMGVISPFTQEFIGSGVEMSLHLTTPLETSVELSPIGQMSVSMKTPEEFSRKEFELIHGFVTPFTVKKSLRTLKPVSKSSSVKPILSGEPLKKVSTNLNRLTGLDMKVLAESDAKYVDLYSYWEKIRQHNWVSLVNLGPLMSSVRMSSTKIIYNPSQSETKELKFHVSLTKGMKLSETEPLKITYPVEYSDRRVIEHVCRRSYPSEGTEYEKCVAQLVSLETISTEAREYCSRHTFPSDTERQSCYKTASICSNAESICESSSTGPRSTSCQEKKHTCYSRFLNIHTLKKMVHEKMINKPGQVLSIRVDSELRGSYSSKTVSSSLTIGSSKDVTGRLIDSYINLEVETPSEPTYEVSVESRTRLPKVTHRWSKERLVEDNMKVECDTEIRFGPRSALRRVLLKSTMVKTEEQKRSVRSSPEYRKCTEEEQLGKKLSPVCQFIRMQAASTDKLFLTVSLPDMPIRKFFEIHPTFYKLTELVKSYFLTQLTLKPSSSSVSPHELKFEVDFSRVGDEAYIKVQHTGYELLVERIRLPLVFKNLIPLSIRNPLFYRFVQKVTQRQTPASCRVEPEYIGTFDNKTYGYKMNDCMHLLYKDCSGKYPIAVLAKSESSSPSTTTTKTVKILSGYTSVVMKPKSSSSSSMTSGVPMTIHLNIKGTEKTIELTQGEVVVKKDSSSGKVLVEMKRYSDDVYSLLFPQEELQVITDGLRIEVIPPQVTRTRSCGLCGDLNGENTADLKTPGMCLVRKNRIAAYTYLLNKSGSESSSVSPRCSGLPSSDRSEYERETRECIRKRTVITPVREILERIYSLIKPTTSVHVVEKQPGQICISKEKVKICSPKKVSSSMGMPKLILEGVKPVELQPRKVQFTCIPRPSTKSVVLEKRAVSGETLYNELSPLPVHFTKITYEPVLCSGVSPSVSLGSSGSNGFDF